MRSGRFAQVAFEKIVKELAAVEHCLQEDPTIAKFSAYWEGVAAKLQSSVTAIGAASVLRSALVLKLTEWDSIKDSYDSQFQTQPAGSSGIN